MNKTDKENKVGSKGGKVIKIETFKKQLSVTQPGFKDQLTLRLSPEQIRSNILYESCTFTTSWESLINPEFVTRQIMADNNGNYCWLAVNEWYNENDERFSGYDCCTNVILEIKIDNVYLYAVFGEFTNSDLCIEEYSWRRGEEAFIKAAALIGVRVTRGLVVAKQEQETSWSW